MFSGLRCAACPSGITNNISRDTLFMMSHAPGNKGRKRGKKYGTLETSVNPNPLS